MCCGLTRLAQKDVINSQQEGATTEETTRNRQVLRVRVLVVDAARGLIEIHHRVHDHRLEREKESWLQDVSMNQG